MTASKNTKSPATNAVTEKFTKPNLNQTLRVKKDMIDKDRQRRKFDADGQILGRLAEKIAMKLMGKQKSQYNDFRDVGDFVVVENVEKIQVTGAKATDKKYYRYSNYKGNLKTSTRSQMMAKKPEEVLKLAVKGMLPKNKLRSSRLKRLKIHTGTTTKYDHFKPNSA